MKKSLLAISIATASLLTLTGCFNQPKKPNFNECKMDGVLAPQWVCMPTDFEGGLVALGTAQPNAAGDYQFQLDEATAAARDALARRIAVKVKNMFKQFKATTGVGKDQTFDKATEAVSKQVAMQTLRNSRLLKVWKSPNGTLYVLVGMPKDEGEQQIKQAVKTSLQNNKALWQKFLSKKAQQELDQAIEKEFGGNNEAQ